MIENIIIQLDVEETSRDGALLAISKIAHQNKIISHEKDIKKLQEEFIKREEIATTAFDDGFAIPHARIKQIVEPAIIVSRFNNRIQDWKSISGQSTMIAIALLIPESKASAMHMDVLAKIATLLLDSEFRSKLKKCNDANEMKSYIIKKIQENPVENTNANEKQNIETKKINIVGVSACATGVAHTYMAKEALEKAGKELNWNVKIETQGQKGQEFKLTDDEIEKADAVIFATDIYVDPERFIGKKFLSVKTNDAIHNPIEVLKKSLVQEVNGTRVSSTKENQSEFKSSKVKTFMGHLLSGVSRMIPFIVFSGIIWAIFNSILRTNPDLENNDAFKIAKNISEIGFTVFIAIMGGFIAESIAGRVGLAVGFITTFAAANSSFYFWWDINGMAGIPQIDAFFKDVKDVSNVGLSLFAAIIMGFASGYLVKWVNTWKTHKLITPIMPIIFIPVVCSSIIIFPFIFLLSGPLGYLMNGLVYGISQAGKIQGLNFLIGCLLGAMIGFDMGGPINKIAGTTATALIPIDPRLMGAVAAAIPIAPIGCGVATLIARKLFNDKEKAEGITALGLGFFGISEGAIPFAMNRPKKVLIANMVGSAVAGGLAFLFFVGGYVGMWGGPITALVLGVKAPITELSNLGTTIPSVFGGGTSGTEFLSILWFFVAIGGGVAIHSSLFIFLIKLDNPAIKEKYANRFKSIFTFKKEQVRK